MSEGPQNNVLDVLVIGAGPAGLTAASLLTKKGKSVLVVEADPKYVGGISKTIEFDGFRCDVGGHRFFSKSSRVENFWSEALPAGMMVRERRSRIYYNAKFFSYPLKGSEALFKLGFGNSVLTILSYFKSKIFPIKNVRTFEDWVVNQFGRKLYKVFFKSYTEKIWGIPCQEISADWAAQRIKGLSLGRAIFNALFTNRNIGDELVKTLVDQFRYPKRGPGQLWEAVAAQVKSHKGQVLMGRTVTALQFQNKEGRASSPRAWRWLRSPLA